MEYVWKIFIMNRYISKSYTTTKNTVEPTIYRAGAAVVSAITSTVLNLEIGQSGSYVPHDLLNYLYWVFSNMV